MNALVMYDIYIYLVSHMQSLLLCADQRHRMKCLMLQILHQISLVGHDDTCGCKWYFYLHLNYL